MTAQTVWLVIVGGRVNSAWSTHEAAAAHVDRLIAVNGSQLAARVQAIEVRP